MTVNDQARLLELMGLSVNGIISARPDLLRQAVEAFDANGDGTPGDFLHADGLVDLSKFDAQGHRGGRNLRPENTLPAMEVALDVLMSMLETDLGITADACQCSIAIRTCKRSSAALPSIPRGQPTMRTLRSW